MRTKHKQTLFYVDDARQIIVVDVGILPLMKALKEHGVVTQYSCEGMPNSHAYFLATGKSMMPLIKKARRAYRQGRLSKSSSAMVSEFLHGHRRFELKHFVGEKPEHEMFSFKLRRGRPSNTSFNVERTLSHRYGHRVTVRWPMERTQDLVKLLSELG